MEVQEGQALSSRSASASYMHHDEWSWPGSAPHSGHGSASRASRIASRLSLVRLRALASSKRRCRPFFNGQLPSVRLPSECIGPRGVLVASPLQISSGKGSPGAFFDHKLPISGESDGGAALEEAPNGPPSKLIAPALGKAGTDIASKEGLDIASSR